MSDFTYADALMRSIEGAVNHKAALAQGWLLGENGDGSLAIQADDDQDTFRAADGASDDDAARAFVIEQAKAGDMNCALALALVLWDEEHAEDDEDDCDEDADDLPVCPKCEHLIAPTESSVEVEGRELHASCAEGGE